MKKDITAKEAGKRGQQVLLRKYGKKRLQDIRKAGAIKGGQANRARLVKLGVVDDHEELLSK